MSRPVKRRNVKSYTRDIENLGRLRTAILMDPTLDLACVTHSVKHIDALVKSLIELHNSVAMKKSA